MHMRKKKWARPELAACPYFFDDPTVLRGKWREQFHTTQPLYLELGCGKGVSTAQMVKSNPHINFVALDIGRDVLGVARRNMEAMFEGEDPKNLILCAGNIEYIEKVFAPCDTVERIYINFCNPWTQKKKHEKRRLTHPRQLVQYRAFMAPEAEIYFKTDDDALFDASLEYFAQMGFEQTYITRDLHADGFSPNYESEHEQLYSKKGVPIKFVIVKRLEQIPAIKDGTDEQVTLVDEL